VHPPEMNHPDTDGVLVALRPPAVKPEPAWSERELARILSDRPAPRRRIRRRLLMPVVIVVGLAATAGGAFAAGLVPSVITDRLNDADSDAIGRVGPSRLLVDLRLSDGTHVQIWRADNAAGGKCEVVTKNLAAGAKPGDFGLTCWAGPPYVVSSVGILHTEDSDYDDLPVLYGERPDNLAGASSVRVSGPGWAATLAIDKTTNGFGIELPPTRQGATFTATYLDVAGHELGTENVTY
jgi:hypothetical protein